MPLTGTRSRLRRPLGTVPPRDLPQPRHAPAVCPCEGPTEAPGPHLATCPWSDPDYEPCGCEESVALRASVERLRSIADLAIALLPRRDAAALRARLDGVP